MIDKLIDAITKDDIKKLVTDGTPEGRRLDHKRALPADQKEEKREFLYDVSAFANASGGLLIFGVDEEPTGVPHA